MERYVPLPPLPARISRLNELAYDLWWSWNAPAREVFRDLDFPLWRFTDHNPVLLLHLVEPDRLEFAATDPQFLRLYDESIASLDAVRAGTGTWWAGEQVSPAPIAWVASHFALHQSLPLDAIADDVICGDFCKEASDIGVPFVGVGLMPPRAYAHQRITADGWQEDTIEHLDWSDAPMRPAVCPDGTLCRFTVAVGPDPVHVVAWQVRAGRSTVYLLDTDVGENSAWDRDLCSRRCGQDADGALRQSALLGAGAVIALDRLGIVPGTWHLAGPSAMAVVFERTHRLVLDGRPFEEAFNTVRATSVFNAGGSAAPNDVPFSVASLDRTMRSTWPVLLEHKDALLARGRQVTDRHEAFNASVFGVAAAAQVLVSRSAANEAQAWSPAEHGASVADTALERREGIHLASWISSEITSVFDTWLGENWRDAQDHDSTWERLDTVPDGAWWTARNRLRSYLVDFLRDRARRSWSRERAGGTRLVALGTLFDPSALTIGCVPRFSSGARPDLLFEDVERVARIATAARRPVQFVFAGRADPADGAGKHHLQRLFRHTLDAAFGGRLAFLEDYDLHAARLMVQGCDVWLTVPPHAGTPSLGAIKAAVNGAPHVGPAASWSASAFRGTNGWMIGAPAGRDGAASDAEQARALYSLIEEQIVPAFYERDRANVAVLWARTVRETLRAALPRYSARHSVKSSAVGVLGSMGINNVRS